MIKMGFRFVCPEKVVARLSCYVGGMAGPMQEMNDFMSQLMMTAMKGGNVGPLMQRIIKEGFNPMLLMQQAAKNDPRLNQVMQMMNGKSPDQIQNMASNMAKERGTTIEQVAQQMGIPIPVGK